MASVGIRGQFDAVQGVRSYTDWSSKNGAANRSRSRSTRQGVGKPSGFRWGLAVTALFLTFGGLVMARGLNVVHAGDKSVNYVVKSGDTLWSIANLVGHAGNHTTDEVLRIIQVNHLSDASIQPGQHLVVPR